MKNILFILPVLLILAGCGDKAVTNVEEKEPVKQVVPVVKEEVEEIDGVIDVSNWETYTSEDYGFSVKYPDDWVVIFTDNKEEIMFSISLLNDKSTGDSIAIIPKGGFDFNWGEVKSIKQGAFANRDVEYYYFDYSDYPTQIRIKELPVGWSELNRIQVNKDSNGDIIDQVLESVIFL